MVLKHPDNQHKGGEKASREFPKCPSKNNEKRGDNKKSQLDRKPFFWGKHLSLGTVYVLQGISEILKSRLKIWTTGDISSFAEARATPHQFSPDTVGCVR